MWGNISKCRLLDPGRIFFKGKEIQHKIRQKTKRLGMIAGQVQRTKLFRHVDYYFIVRVFFKLSRIRCSLYAYFKTVCCNIHFLLPVLWHIVDINYNTSQNCCCKNVDSTILFELEIELNVLLSYLHDWLRHCVDGYLKVYFVCKNHGWCR